MHYFNCCNFKKVLAVKVVTLFSLAKNMKKSSIYYRKDKDIMNFEESSKQAYQTVVNILTEMVSNYMENQSHKGDDYGARDDESIQPTKSTGTD